MRRVRSLAGVILALSVGAAWVGQPTPATRAPVLEALIDNLRAEGTLEIKGRTIYADPVVLAVYERRSYEPLWSDVDLDALLRAVHSTSTDGIDPDIYHETLLTGLSILPLGPELSAELDLLATDAFVRLSRDLRYGRVPQVESDVPGPKLGPFGSPDPPGEILRVVASGLLEQRVAELRPSHFEYDRLVRGLVELRAIERRGGWEPIPTGPTMLRDSADARIPLLRHRLILTGDYRQEGQGASDPDPMSFDRALETAVRHFQHRHGLNEDGRVGGATLASLNVPVEGRIEQVRVNLERARRAERDLPAEYVSVNVPGARVYMSRGSTVEFETRAVVGEEETQTPTFDALMSYIELNPTWTVPRGMVEELLEAVLDDPRYLSDRQMHVLSSKGVAVDPTTLDFTAFTPETFPYVFHQEPGPLNPLGRIKLIFPNEYAIYLHDSPARWAFAEEERLFSHGCVRVEDPVGLAMAVLHEPDTWDREALEDAIAEGETLAIPLTQPLRVYIVYRTVEADRAGTLHFYEDVYDRDPAVLALLDRR